MDRTPHLDMPYILPSQAQKHVTHNEALAALDTLVQLGVIDRDLSAPPGSPVEGDRYIVGGAATGDWAGHDGEIAVWLDGAWRFFAPAPGWTAWAADEGAILAFVAGGWVPLPVAAAAEAALFGVNTSADATNRLAVKADATLFSHDDVTPGTGDMRQKLNKQAAANTVSQLYQNGFSGRAETGLIGDDDFVFKVSPDGTTWYEALRLDRNSGRVGLTQGQLAFPATHNPSADANTLDDYEEGSFTPTVAGATTAGSYSYSIQSGSYVKAGRIVSVKLDLQVNTVVSAGSGVLRIMGLPFGPADNNVGAGGVIFSSAVAGVPSGFLAWMPVVMTGPYVQMRYLTTAGNAGNANIETVVQASTRIIIALVYEASA